MITYFRVSVLVAAFSFFSCEKNHRQFNVMLEQLPVSKTGVDFSNDLLEDQSINIIEYLYYYNGGGVATGDINNDGLEDLFFISNQGTSRLYLNEGDFEFKDLTSKSGIQPAGNWHTGVNMVDINQDGLTDLFICGVGGYKNLQSYNQVWINNGDLTFTDQTKELGLDFQGFSTHTSFFDYDQDGDLDLYLLNHSVHSVRSVGTVDLRRQTEAPAGDLLYENQFIPNGKLFFKSVTTQAGILNSAVGYGLGIGAGDLNMDGKTDLYVSNDFFENDYLYLNQGNGTFKEVIEQSMAHSSRFSMGNTISDLNNDLLPDIISLDMLPMQESVIKTSAGEDPFDIFEYKKRLGFHYQFARNALQLNQGIDENGIPKFSDIAPLAGIDATDWSWAPLAADWDNDGWKDIFISNGIRRRPNDMDYISFISSDSTNQDQPIETFLKQMPDGSVPNAMFKNDGQLQFKNMSGTWLENKPGLSNGSVYTDLDNDGDLDLVVNNLNEKAGIYRNNQNVNNGISIKLIGEKPNLDAYGSKIFLYSNALVQYQEVQPSKGFQSAVSPRVHFGLKNNLQPDSIIVIWPDQKKQKVLFQDKSIVKVLTITKDLTEAHQASKETSDPKPFELIYEGIPHQDNNYTAFQTERLVPHSLDALGPRLAIGDIDQNGLKDIYRPGTSAGSGFWFKNFNQAKFSSTKEVKSDLFQADESSVILFDANGDSHQDMLILPGGQQPLIPTSYFPELWLNNGRGDFKLAPNHLPTIALCGSIAIASDIDRDGDQDIFLGGNVAPANYGLIPFSYLLINDGKGRFQNQTSLWFAGTGGKLGMIMDALWTDINKDNYPDLITAGEWMPVQIWINQDGHHFLNATKDWNLQKTSGLWHRISAGDFDSDGDIDLLAGNYGLNSRLKASEENPVRLYITDLDDNGSIDQILEYYNNEKPWPFWSKDQITKQAPSMKKHFLAYSSYQNISTADLLTLAGKQNPEKREVEILESVYLENNNGKFIKHNLPIEAQFAPIFAICPVDLNGDAYTDFLIGGNLLHVTPELGRMNATRGLVLLGKGTGQFSVLNGVQSGLLLEGECRDIQLLDVQNGSAYFSVAMNNGPLKIFQLNREAFKK